MGRRGKLASGLIGFGVLAGAPPELPPPAPGAMRAVEVVTIDVRCTTGISVSVDKLSVTLSKATSDEVQWKVTGHTSARAAIRPKDRSFPLIGPRRWPFSVKKHDPTRATSVSSGEPVRANPKKDEEITYRYRVIATCQVTNGPLLRVTIDPEVIITE